MKKLFIFLLFGILLAVPLVSSADWDNILTYSENDLKVTLKNSILWIIPTSEIGIAELKSHSFVDEIIEVGAGNQVPMFYDFSDFKELYLNGLGEVYFTDMRTGKQIDRDYSFVYWGKKERNIYGKGKCFLNINGTQTCETIVVGKETYNDWLPYNSLDIPKGNTRIGLMTYVEIKDKVDGVWTIAGKKVKRHAVWTAELDVGLIAYYKLDEQDTTGSGTILDELEDYNGSNVGADNTTGKINTAYYFNSAVSDYINVPPNPTISAYPFSYSGWGKTTLTTYGIFLDISFNATSESNFAIGIDDTGNATGITRNLGSAADWIETPSTINDGNWHHLAIVYTNSTHRELFVDGSSSAVQTTEVPFAGGTYRLSMGRLGDITPSQYWNGSIDEIGIWGRGLIPDEILLLSQAPPYGLIGLKIVLFSPENTANFTIQTINFSANVSDLNLLGIQNVTLEVIHPNGTLFYSNTNTSGFAGVYNWTDINFLDGDWNWSVSAYDDDNESWESDMRIFNIDTTPFIQFENPTPVNYYNSSNSYVPINVSLTETYFENITFRFYNDTITEFYYEDSTRFINKSFSDGIYSYNVTVWTTTDKTNSTETRNITIDTTTPIITTNSSITFNHQEINTNLTIYFNITETHPDTCLYNYNGTNISIGCGDTSLIVNTTTLTNRNIILYANDTFGLETTFNISWNYTVFENSQTFNSETFEGVINTFIANVTIIESNLITIANLIYNGTSYSNSFSQSGNDFILIIEFLVPEVNTDTNLTFFWSLTFLDGQIINLTSQNQTVIALSLDDCSVNTVVLYNYTVVDEKNQSILSNPINTTTELNINLLDITRQNYIVNFSKKYLKINPFAVCINKNFSSSTYLVDSIVKYEATGYSIEYYNIVNSTITNSTIPVNITLYDLFSADATEFKITFKAEDFTFVEDALIYIDRQYIAENNTFKTVELPKTDSNGQTVGHFVRSDVLYNIRVIKDGIVLGNFKNQIAFCEDYTIGDCQMVLEAVPEDLITFDYDEQLGIIFQILPLYNEDTSSISFDFSTNDGSIKTVSMDVTRDDIFGNRSICNNTLTSSSGTLVCSFDPNIDDSVLRVGVSVDGQPIVLSSVRLESSDYGNLGYVLWFFLTFLFVLLFGHSKTEVLVGLAISFIGAISLGITRGDIIGLGSAGIWVLLIIILGIVKLNKDKPQ